jgi:excisionase family DNA binding protein
MQKTIDERKLEQTVLESLGDSDMSTTTQTEEKALLRQREVQQLLGVGRDRVRSLIESGELPVVRFGPKTRRFDPADVLALAERLKTKGRSKQSGGGCLMRGGHRYADVKASLAAAEKDRHEHRCELGRLRGPRGPTGPRPKWSGKRAAFYVPVGLDMERYVGSDSEGNPVPWRDCAGYFLNLCHWQWVCWRADGDGFLHLPYDLLTKITPREVWVPLRAKLLADGVIECDRVSDTGRAYGYRVTPDYWKTRRVYCPEAVRECKNTANVPEDVERFIRVCEEGRFYESHTVYIPSSASSRLRRGGLSGGGSWSPGSEATPPTGWCSSRPRPRVPRTRPTVTLC